jgi:hypothetical protein
MVMKLNDFQDKTKARTPRMLDRIAPIDAALKKFHDADTAKPKVYAKVAKQAQVLLVAARKFLSDKPEANRKDAVESLVQQIAVESEFLSLVAKADDAADDMAQFKALEKAQEFVRRNIAVIGLARPGASPEITDLIDKHSVQMRDASRGGALVLRDIEKLKKLAQDPALPGVLKAVILETTAAGNVQQVDPAVMSPGLKFNKTKGPGVKKYTLNHNMSQYMGRRFRMGSLLHELTHLSNAEVFDNSPLMLAAVKSASDTEMTTIASQRRGRLMSLKSEIEKATGIDGDLKGELLGKVSYPIMGKFQSYLGAFKSQLDPALHLRLTNLMRAGMDCELIEYDSVVNQMFLWCHLFDVDAVSATYTKLQSMVEDAYRYRQMAKLSKRPLPAVPVRKPAMPAPAPPRKPLPQIPVTR